MLAGRGGCFPLEDFYVFQFNRDTIEFFTKASTNLYKVDSCMQEFKNPI